MVSLSDAFPILEWGILLSKKSPGKISYPDLEWLDLLSSTSSSIKISGHICGIWLHEIFAADFRDRVVHHLIYNYISPVFEKTFIHDSYSCRKGKGTHFDINRTNHFIPSCSEKYTLDCYILKLDIQGYFMSIDKFILFEMIRSPLERTTITNPFDTNQLVQLIRKSIFHDPTKSYSLKGNRSDWNGLPA